MAEDKEFNFIKSRLESLPSAAPGKRDEYRDTKVPGLILRVTDKGSKTFAVYRRVQGKPARRAIGPYPDLSIEQARKKAQEYNGTIALGEDPHETRRQAKAELTFGQVFAKYLAGHSKPHKRSWKSDQYQYDRFLKDRWANRKLSSISKDDVRELHAKIGKENGHYSANRLLAMVKAIFNWGLSNSHYQGVNPAKGIQRFKETSRERRLHPHEIGAFLEAVADEPNETIRDYVLLSLWTGARRSNVQAMRWDQISFERATWTIPETKNGTSQTVPLAPAAIEILERRSASKSSPYVFPGSGKSGHLVEPKKGWQRILDSANLQDLRLHDLRRTVGSWMADEGATLAIVGKALNHKSPATTQIYARLSIDPVREAMEKGIAAMFEAAKPMPASKCEEAEDGWEDW